MNDEPGPASRVGSLRKSRSEKKDFCDGLALANGSSARGQPAPLLHATRGLAGSSLFVFIINYEHHQCTSIIYLRPAWATRAAA